MKKQAAALASALVSLSMVVVGCSGGGQGSREGETPAAAKAPSASQSTEGPKAPLKLSIMATYYTPQPPNNQSDIWKKLQEMTNTQIDMTWVPRSAYDDKVSVSIASNDLPKVLLALNSSSPPLVNAIKSGLFWEIGPYLKDYKNLSALSKVQFESTKIQGKTYSLYRSRPLARFGVTFRKDWLDNLNLKEPKTPEEMYEVMKAFTKNDPDKNGKDDTYGVLAFKDGQGYLIPHIASWFGAPNDWKEENGQFTPSFMTSEYFEALKYIKRLYDEKLMNQDFVVTEEQQMNSLYNQGKAGINLGLFDDVGKMQLELRKINPQAKVGILDTITGPKGQRIWSQPGYTGVYLFPKSSVKTEAELKEILAYFDRLQEPDAVNLLTWGIEGKQYKLTNGQAEKIVSDDAFNNDTLGLGELRIDDGSKELVLTGEDPLTTKGKQLIKDNVKIVVTNPALSLYFESPTWSQKSNELKKIVSDGAVKFIMGKIDEDGWKKVQEDWKKAGGDKVLTEFADIFAKSKSK
ncbi:extracellular solute-binding protein [Paenibacillus sp. H1-7]|uniref:extracellular solute-binding protein n=1 Tax=Paenibacillus sp. H1-7 TaxID=2282849 RepID=UPI001EF90AD9|nr:extracellular solute-binding protein [Paenibacillus sp. H1-7]ULL16902.1 extracellular solute-binding protein [Paenibacillus sp. H1-7]